MADEWLDNLKAGDEVITCSGYYGKSVSKVQRTTATQIVTEKGGKYWKKNGKRVGDTDWNISYITEPTQEIRNEIRKAALCDKLSRVVWQKLSVDILAEIFDKVKNGQHLK